MKFQNWFLFTCLILGLYACGDGQASSNYIPNIENTPKVKLPIVRFDEKLHKADTSKALALFEQLHSAYPKFTELYTEHMIYNVPNGNLADNLKALLSFEPVKPLLDTVMQTYSNLDDLQLEISEMVRYRNYYFPNASPIDTLFTYISLYNYGAGFFDNYAILGLDYFLGENHMAYQAIEQIAPLYIRRTLNKAHITRALAYAQATLLVEEMASRGGSKMIDYMLYEGKKFFLTKSFLPQTADSIVYAFTREQMAHCIQGERSLYDYLLKEKLFYSDKYKEFQKYVEIGPFNPANALYGNSGTWLGGEIVGQYAAHLRKTTQKSDSEIMQIILQENNPQIFFKHYKPRR